MEAKKLTKLDKSENWGGIRPGAGRKKIERDENRKTHSLYCTESEFKNLKLMLEIFRMGIPSKYFSLEMCKALKLGELSDLGTVIDKAYKFHKQLINKQS